MWWPWLPGGSAGKETACNAGDLGLIPGLGRSPGEGSWLPSPVFWPGEFHGLHNPWCCKELHTTDWLSFSLSLSISPWRVHIPYYDIWSLRLTLYWLLSFPITVLWVLVTSPYLRAGMFLSVISTALIPLLHKSFSLMQNPFLYDLDSKLLLLENSSLLGCLPFVLQA